MHVFLIGYMGSGKTTFGKKLAKKLNRHFFDTDKLIESAYNMSVTELFNMHGEVHFREIERNTFDEIPNFPYAIIATGGGLPCYSGLMDRLNNTGWTVYLEATPTEILSRIGQNKRAIHSRPLLKNIPEGDLIAFITDKLAERHPIYSQAHLKVKAINASVEELTVELTKLETIAASNHLNSSESLDFNHPKIQDYIAPFLKLPSKKDQAIAIYNAVRDGQLYDPYHLDLRTCSLRASVIVSKKRAWCVEKSILLAACARAMGIPAKLGFAIVRNHLGADRLVQFLKKDEIVFHGFASLFIEGKWTICTPAFDKAVCRLAKVEPLAYNAESDSMFQEFSATGKFMEYLHYYGEFNDVPFDLMKSEMQKHYPHLFEKTYNNTDFSFLY